MKKLLLLVISIAVILTVPACKNLSCKKAAPIETPAPTEPAPMEPTPIEHAE